MNTAIKQVNQTNAPAAQQLITATPIYVAYDIAQQKRRNNLHRLLRGFGRPVQKSVFLCWLDAARQRRLKTLLADFSRIEHSGCERIEIIRAHEAENRSPPDNWVFE